ncbi:MAG: MATE family efflux transporter [Planctomycetes bacterium]|nr:MATE family efflux transporter [Planctomycetota bacterium]
MSSRQKDTPGAGGGWKAELRALGGLAGPVVFVQLGLMLTSVVDTAMLGRVSETAQAAGALGHVYSMAMLWMGSGLLMALDPLVAQAYGARDERALARHLREGLAVALLLTVVLSLPLLGARWAFEVTKQPPEVAEAATAYVLRLVPGNGGFFLFLALRQTLTALGAMRPIVLAMLAGNLVNLVANWVLIFGALGAPALGVEGAAWATSFSRWVMAGMTWWAAQPLLRRYLAAPRAPRGAWRGSLRLWIRVGVPIMAHVSAEVWIFSVVGMLMGPLGSAALAGHSIALNLASLSFMVPLGIAAAAAVRVGRAIGAEDPEGARRAAAVSLCCGMGVMCLSAASFAFLPELLARCYTEAPSTIAVAASLLPVAAAFQIFDGLQVVGSGVLRGTGDTKIPALLALIGYWGLGLPAGYALAFSCGLGPAGLWWGLSIGLGSVGLLLLARIVRRMRGELRRVA